MFLYIFQPSDALKSKEKLEEEEKKKIEELEKQRQERMLSQEEKAPKRTQTIKHRYNKLNILSMLLYGHSKGHKLPLNISFVLIINCHNSALPMHQIVYIN